MTQAKICGVCRPEDAEFARSAGADYIGVILAPGSRRSQDAMSAAAIFEAAGDGIGRVGVFVEAELPEVVAMARRLSLDIVQLHGAETAEMVKQVRAAGPWRVWKAVRPRSAAELDAAIVEYDGIADALLLDGWSGSAAGGTGARAPWTDLATSREALSGRTRLVLAGGLDASVLPQAIATLRPDVVDVSSGVEAEVGKKDPERVAAFVAAAHRHG